MTTKVSASKEFIERIIQCMVIKYYLEEESIGNASGFSADYIRVMFAPVLNYKSHSDVSLVVMLLNFRLARG